MIDGSFKEPALWHTSLPPVMET